MARLGLGMVNWVLGALIVLFLGAVAVGLIAAAWDSFWTGTADTPKEVAAAVVRDGYGERATDCRLIGEHVSIDEIWQCSVTSEGIGVLEKCYTTTAQSVFETSCSYAKPENGGRPTEGS